MIFDTQTIILLIFGVAILVLCITIVRIENRLSKILRGKDAKTLDESVSNINKELKDFYDFRKEVEKYLVSVEKRLKKSVQGVSTTRFNAFKGSNTGGNQSFASAFLNEKGDGVVISSLYSRDVVGVYAKPVTAGTSKYELSEEEQEAIKTAITEVKN